MQVRGHYRWGHVLDAGTGVDSMSWLCTQPTESIVAATAADWMRKKMRKKLALPCLAPNNDGDGDGGHETPNVVLVGNWLKPAEGQHELTRHPAYTAVQAKGGFDTVLADYLLGSLEYYSE